MKQKNKKYTLTKNIKDDMIFCGIIKYFKVEVAKNIIKSLELSRVMKKIERGFCRKVCECLIKHLGLERISLVLTLVRLM